MINYIETDLLNIKYASEEDVADYFKRAAEAQKIVNDYRENFCDDVDLSNYTNEDMNNMINPDNTTVHMFLVTDNISKEEYYVCYHLEDKCVVYATTVVSRYHDGELNENSPDKDKSVKTGIEKWILKDNFKRFRYELTKLLYMMLTWDN